MRHARQLPGAKLPLQGPTIHAGPSVFPVGQPDRSQFPVRYGVGRWDVVPRFEGATIDLRSFLFPPNQPELISFDQQQQQIRYQVPTVPFRETLAPTITGSLDWMQTSVEIVWI